MALHSVVRVFSMVLLQGVCDSAKSLHSISQEDTSKECTRIGKKRPYVKTETMLLQVKAQNHGMSNCCKQCGGKPFCSPTSGKCYDWRESDYPYVTCATYTDAASAEDGTGSNETVTTRVSVDSESPCLCVFDIDRTLTGAQGQVEKCPRNKEVPGVHDEAYGSGWLTLSALSVDGISNTFCNKCNIGISSAGDAGGENSKERVYLLEYVLVTDVQKQFIAQHPDATKWSYWGDVNSPLSLNVPNKKKQFSVEDIRQWYQRQGAYIPKEEVYFFGDRMENIPHFQELGFNAREISCETRDEKLYEGSGMVGFCGAKPEEIIRKQGIYSCPGDRPDHKACCQKCGEKGFCSPESGRCYESKKKDYYLTCSISAEAPSCCGNCGDNTFCSPKSGRCYDSKKKPYYAICDISR